MDALERATGAVVLASGVAKHAPGLAFDEDLACVAEARSDGLPGGVEGAEVPGAVPGVLLDGGEHLLVRGVDFRRVLFPLEVAIEACELAARIEVEAGDHHRFGA